MIPLADYHMHTPLCGHAMGEPFEYAEQALKLGLSEIGFSDHAPFLKCPLPGITMEMDDLLVYHKMIERVRGQFSGRLSIKVGIEADFLPGFEDQTYEMLLEYPYDYVYGSVHFIEDWAFDNPDQKEQWGEADINDVYIEYYSLLQQAVQSNLFDIIAHIDLVKKFGHRATNDLSAEVRETAKIFREHGTAIEINTSGLRKEVKEIYPSFEVLKIFAQEGVDIVFGSDAHHSEDVGRDFDEARELALTVGYKDYVIFKNREIEKRIPLI